MVTRFLLPAVVILAVIVAAVVSAAGEETRVELEYMESIRTQSEELASSGMSIADVMSRIDQIDRDEFTTVFDSVDGDLNEAESFVAEEPPTESLIPVWALYRQAVTAWDDGVRGLSASILRAADHPDDVNVINGTADSLAELCNGDALFQDLKTEFEREEIPEPVSPPVDVVLCPTEEGLLSQSVSYVAAARRSTAQLGLRPGLRVSQVVSDPGWQIDVENQVVVAATETIGFTAVITNTGNVASEPESLIMELHGGAEPVVATAEVPSLQPDGQTTIEFEPLPVLPETPYTVRVALELSNPDSDPTDNAKEVMFTVDAE